MLIVQASLSHKVMCVMYKKDGVIFQRRSWLRLDFVSVENVC